MTISASDFDAPFEALFDRTAYLKARHEGLVPYVFETANTSNTWAKPAGAIFVDFLLVGAGGGGGGVTTVHAGGGGGGAGGVVRSLMGVPADLVPALLYTFASGAGTGSIVDGSDGLSAVLNSDNSRTVRGDWWLEAPGGEGGSQGSAATGGRGGWTKYEEGGTIYVSDTQVSGGDGGDEGAGNDGTLGGETSVATRMLAGLQLMGASGTVGVGATGSPGPGTGGGYGVGHGCGGSGAGGNQIAAGTYGGGGGAAGRGYGHQEVAGTDGEDGRAFGSLLTRRGGDGVSGRIWITTWRTP